MTDVNPCKDLIASDAQFVLDNNGQTLADFRLNERIFLVSESGAGKTTLLKRIVGVIRDSNDVRFLDGSEILEEQLPLLRRKLALLQQQTFGNSESLRLQLSFASRCLNENDEEAIDRASSILKIFGRPELIDVATDTLSGGEKQLVLVTKAFVFKPQFLLLDEPTTALDDELKSKVESFILSSPIGFIWVTHDKQQIHRLGALETKRLSLERVTSRS